MTAATTKTAPSKIKGVRVRKTGSLPAEYCVPGHDIRPDDAVGGKSRAPGGTRRGDSGGSAALSVARPGTTPV